MNGTLKKLAASALTAVMLTAGALAAKADVMPEVLYDTDQYVLSLEYTGLDMTGLDRINARYGSDGYSTAQEGEIIQGGCSITFAEYDDGRIGAVRNMDLQATPNCSYELMVHPGENVKYETWALAYTGADEKPYKQILEEGISDGRYASIPFTATDAMSFGLDENGDRASLYCGLLIRSEQQNEDGSYCWVCPGTYPDAEIRCGTQSTAMLIAVNCLTIDDALKLTGAVDENYQRLYPDVQPVLDVYSLNIETETNSCHWFEVVVMEDSTGRHGALEFIDNYPIWHEGIDYSFNFFLQDEYLYNPDGTYREQYGAGIGRYKAVVPYLDKIHTVTDHVALMDGIRYSFLTFYNEEKDYIGYDWNSQLVDWRSEKVQTDVWGDYNKYVELGLDVSAADAKYPLWARYLDTDTGELVVIDSLESWKENREHLKPVYDMNYVLSDRNYEEIMNVIRWSGYFYDSLTPEEVQKTNSGWMTYFKVVCDPMRFRVTRWFTEDVTTADTICWQTIFGNDTNDNAKQGDNMNTTVSDEIKALYEEHAIGLETVLNARHMGGYTTADGRKTRAGGVLRTAKLADVSDEEAAILRDEWGLTDVVDFRIAQERTTAPDREIDGVENTWISVMELDGGSVLSRLDKPAGEADKIDIVIASARAMGGLQKLYAGLVRNELSQKGYRHFFDVLLSSKGTVLWHCSEGKDRTGFAAVLLLSALGVDRETILDDYEASNVVYAERRNAFCSVLAERGVPEEEIGMIADLLAVDRSAMAAAMDLIDAEYGGMDAYLHEQIGLTDEEIAALQAKYLE